MQPGAGAGAGAGAGVLTFGELAALDTKAALERKLAAVARPGGAGSDLSTAAERNASERQSRLGLLDAISEAHDRERAPAQLPRE